MLVSIAEFLEILQGLSPHEQNQSIINLEPHVFLNVNCYLKSNFCKQLAKIFYKNACLILATSTREEEVILNFVSLERTLQRILDNPFFHESIKETFLEQGVVDGLKRLGGVRSFSEDETPSVLDIILTFLEQKSVFCFVVFPRIYCDNLDEARELLVRVKNVLARQQEYIQLSLTWDFIDNRHSGEYTLRWLGPNMHSLMYEDHSNLTYYEQFYVQQDYFEVLSNGQTLPLNMNFVEDDLAEQEPRTMLVTPILRGRAVSEDMEDAQTVDMYQLS